MEKENCESPVRSQSQTEALEDLHCQIVDLICTRLTDQCIEVMQKELQLMKRSSYYLKIQHNDQPSASDAVQNILWTVIDKQRRRHAMTTANTHVKLLLTHLKLLYDDIIECYEELVDFCNLYDKGLVDRDVAASAEQKLQQTQKYVDEFKSSLTQNLGPLNLPKQLIPNTGYFPTLVVKMPVLFNRSKSCAISNGVNLAWEVEGEQPSQQFKISVERLYPTSAEHAHSITFTSQSYSTQVSRLIPDTYYRFSVQRLDAVNLVYGLWFDTMILKTLSISK